MKYISVFLLLLITPAAMAAKLDLSTHIRMRALSYENLNFSADSPLNDSFYSQNASLGFVLKDLRLEKSKDSTMDVGIVLKGIGIAGSSVVAKAPFDRIASRYPNSNFTPFIQQAYIKVYRAFDKNITMTFGRQRFELGSGMVLSDDGLGFTGARVEFTPLWKEIQGEVFVFKPVSSHAGRDTIDVYGVSFGIPLEGLWEFYSFWERDWDTSSLPNIPNVPLKSVMRRFSGVRYSINYSFFSFDGEAVFQTGKAVPSDPANAELKFNGSAFLMKGKWTQPMGQWGTGSARLIIGRGSGDKPGTQGTDEAFFPSFGHRYDGIERDGFGSIFGATLYDSLRTSDTVSGLPGTASGIRVLGLGVTFPPYKGIHADMALFMFKADRVALGSKGIGNEFNLRLVHPFGENFKIQLTYAKFSPKSIYPAGIKDVKLVSFQATGKF